MSSTTGRVVQVILVLAGMAGLALLAWKRRWEAIAIALPILTVTAIGAVTLAPPRRNEILMTLVLPLAVVFFAGSATRLFGRFGPFGHDSGPPSNADPI